MIPTKATPAEFDRYVSNIVAAYRAATPAQIAKGNAWYPVAHELALQIGNGNARKGAGIIAALSANKSWSLNVRLATDAGNGNLHGHVADALGKARAIQAGIDPAEVLPMDKKTGNFFRNIFDPSDPAAVTIDRHAHDIAVGEVYGNRDRGLSNPTRYATLLRAYIVAGAVLNELASRVQAGTWQAQIEKLAGTGTRGMSRAA
jgi:hypothetical protein